MSSDEKQKIRIAVRTLAESVYRSGGLAGPVYTGVSDAEGQKLHKKFLRIMEDRFPDKNIESEVVLDLVTETGDYLLQVSGRCDALVRETDLPVLIEVKSYSGPKEQLPAAGELIHLAQALLYAHIYLMQKEADIRPAAVKVSLCYINSETSAITDISKNYTAEQLRRFFTKTCDLYISFAANIISSRKSRQQSGIDCRFPYPDLRDGQKRFMQEVIGAIRQKNALLVQAPTGIGKTMSALYPAVKALANNLVDHVFYLTAMTSTRLVAADAVRDLRRCGLRMKSLVIFAKEKLCLQPDIYCDTRQCPYATGYYDHLPAALQQLFLYEDIGREEILACARQYRLCPFELSLDLATYCELVICDYNYAFDPRVHLARFFNQDPMSHLLLVDEAHNLPDRSREMFSASLEGKQLQIARKALEGQSAALEQSLDTLISYMERLAAKMADNECPAFDLVEKDSKPAAVMIAPSFRGMRSQPLTLLGLLGRFSFQAYSFLEQQPPWTLRKQLLDAWFPALFFLRIAEQYYDDTYVTTAEYKADGLEIKLMCLDAAEKLTATYRDRHPAVFFSATLSPMSYYQSLLCGHKSDYTPEKLLLPSPFPVENLLVMTCGRFSTRFRQRQETIDNIAHLIMQAVSARTGNYLVFLPSYKYLEQLRQILRILNRHEQVELLAQRPDLSENQRRGFLQRFEKFGQKTLLALAVMGGQFAEGVDLIGEKLSGVIIVGVGLPQISPQREIMKQYYAGALGNGYAYAYMFPGFNKVQQAAGRLIRSENDRGFILLIDDRYDLPTYHQLFPEGWHPQPVRETEELLALLRDFWGQA